VQPGLQGDPDVVVRVDERVVQVEHEVGPVGALRRDHQGGAGRRERRRHVRRVAERERRIDERPDVRQVEADGRRDNLGVQPPDEVEEHRGFGGGQVRVPDALARVLDADQVPAGHAATGRRERVVDAFAGRVATRDPSRHSGQLRRGHDDVLELLVECPRPQRVRDRIPDRFVHAHHP
jgi:hypothetical protein